jgi:hypothetical protein
MNNPFYFFCLFFWFFLGYYTTTQNLPTPWICTNFHKLGGGVGEGGTFTFVSFLPKSCHKACMWEEDVLLCQPQLLHLIAHPHTTPALWWQFFPESKHLVLTTYCSLSHTSSAWIGNNKLKSEVLGSTSQVPLKGTLYVHQSLSPRKEHIGACVHLLF